MTNSTKSVSIIIRTKNEAKWIGSCLRNVLNQEYQYKKEIIVVDNNSSDETREIVKKYKVKLINYNPNFYLPGLALNKAVKIAKNEIVVFLSAHCIPTSKNWLKNLTSSLLKIQLLFMEDNYHILFRHLMIREIYLINLVLKKEFN